MADNDQFSGDTNKKDYEDMSRDELVSIIGVEVDPAASRDELVMMAIEADRDSNR